MAGDRLARTLSLLDPEQAPSRERLRSLVADCRADIEDKVREGANPVHVSLNQGDQIDAYIARIPDQHKELFVRLYAEEMQATITEVRAAVEQKENVEFASALGTYSVTSTLVWIVSVVFVILVLKLMF